EFRRVLFRSRQHRVIRRIRPARAVGCTPFKRCCMSFGSIVFLLAPPALAGVLLWRFPESRRVRPRSLLLYLAVMSLLIWGALRFVASVAAARVSLWEVAVVLWFTIAWRLAWALWTRTVGNWGQQHIRRAKLRRAEGSAGKTRPPLWPAMVIPAGRATLTALIFFPLFLSMVVTHRCKLSDDTDPGALGMGF